MDDQGGAEGRGRRSAHDTRTTPDRGDLSERLSALARDHPRRADQQDALDRIVATAVTTVPRAEDRRPSG